MEEGIEKKKISEKNMKNVTFIHRICPIYSWAGSIGKGDVTEYGRELRKMKLIKTFQQKRPRMATSVQFSRSVMSDS